MLLVEGGMQLWYWLRSVPVQMMLDKQRLALTTAHLDEVRRILRELPLRAKDRRQLVCWDGQGVLFKFGLVLVPLVLFHLVQLCSIWGK